MAVATERAVAAAPLLPHPWRVAETWRETGDVVTLALEPAAGAGGCDWQPGQFNMLYAFGAGEVPISVSGGTSQRLLHTIREVGPVTRALGALAPGSIVGLRGPFGTAWPLRDARGRDLVIAAGGIGLAPLRALIEAVCRDRDAFGEVAVLYGTRSPADQLYRPDLDRWRRTGLRVETTVDHADVDWRGHVGVVTSLIRRLRFDGQRTTAFLCGPEIMMRFTARQLALAGVADDQAWVSLERNMQCATGHCGHCQLGPVFVCTDGPVFAWQRVRRLLTVRAL
jgi:NAD(P)H-flavin reductase